MYVDGGDSSDNLDLMALIALKNILVPPKACQVLRWKGFPDRGSRTIREDGLIYNWMRF